MMHIPYFHLFSYGVQYYVVQTVTNQVVDWLMSWYAMMFWCSLRKIGFETNKSCCTVQTMLYILSHSPHTSQTCQPCTCPPIGRWRWTGNILASLLSKKIKGGIDPSWSGTKNAQFLGCWFLLFYDVSSFANLLSAFGHAMAQAPLLLLFWSGPANTRIQA